MQPYATQDVVRWSKTYLNLKNIEIRNLILWSQKLRKIGETYIFRFRFCLDVLILHFFLELIVYLLCYLLNKCLFFPRFILFISLNTYGEYH